MKLTAYTISLAIILFLLGPPHGGASEVVVKNSEELQTALREIEPGTTVLIAPGNYRGDVFLANVNGTKDRRIVIKGLDPDQPPVFSGGAQGLALSDCSFVTISTLVIKGFSDNGINIDDAGTYDSPAYHIILENLTILETGPWGNYDALKLSGVKYFVVRKCRFQGWGGSAIDMVGCHHGVIEDCCFEGREGFSQHNGVQMKGGSSEILVQTSFFYGAGIHALKIGGHTGLKYFRPQDSCYEAEGITVAGNRFVGSKSHISWITAVGGNVHHNTLVFPEKSVIRILQGTRDKNFKPCRGGIFANNLVVYDRKVNRFFNRLVEVGPNTLPETFTFHHNAWFQIDGKTMPSLPSSETDGVYQINPQLDSLESPTMRIGSKSPLLKDIGADAYLPVKKEL